ncbi:MAG: FAD-dependent oxidoreductase [Myxococcota bacterium]
MGDRRRAWTTAAERRFDIVVIGGGATGMGIAVDAASRGLAVALVEQSDFGKGTSSRSTKLVHGGVRYLRQGQIGLVTEALEERGRLKRNARHLFRDQPFVVPSYDWWEKPFYGVGLKMYDLLARSAGLGKSRALNRTEALAMVPQLEPEGLRGGILYYDGQFDDSRLIVSLARTAHEHGAVMLNYVRCVGLLKDGSHTVGIEAEDVESGQRIAVAARVVVNATGCFSDGVRRLDDPAVPPIIAPSQGTHIVLDASFLGGDAALMVPETPDGRVLFAIPWHGVAIVGTTDRSIPEVSLEPRATEEEVDFILNTATDYMAKKPTRADIRSVFVGIRPLVKPEGMTSTASISREHSIDVSPSGLVTIVGGKWTTYRRMAEDCVDRVVSEARLHASPCQTSNLKLMDHHDDPQSLGALWMYGTEAPKVAALQNGGGRLHSNLPLTAGQVLFAARHEYARTVDDVMSRRTRCLLIDAEASATIAPKVARLLARALARDRMWEEKQIISFRRLASAYRARTEPLRGKRIPSRYQHVE